MIDHEPFDESMMARTTTREKESGMEKDGKLGSGIRGVWRGSIAGEDGVPEERGSVRLFSAP